MASYPSLNLLEAAAQHLARAHPIAAVSIPALLGAARKAAVSPTTLIAFGSPQENALLNELRVPEAGNKIVAFWQSPVQLVNSDYAGSTLQRQRTKDLSDAFMDDFDPPTSPRRKKFAVHPRAGQVLRAHTATVPKVALATWLGRLAEFASLQELRKWFDENFPMEGTDLDTIYTDDIPPVMAAVADPFSDEPTNIPEIVARFDVAVTPKEDKVPPTGPSTISLESEGLEWTRQVCALPLPVVDINATTERVRSLLSERHVVLPDEERLVARCVTALLVGHLILQGPPGTGKTTLARALAEGFDAGLVHSTATSDWSPYHVVGGLRPDRRGGLTPTLGTVSSSALACAETVRSTVGAEESANERYVAIWLLIDEFNRADIDKAIGSLYTLLSSCDANHVEQTPIDLWFEDADNRRRLWVPARYRIVGTMNDLDTNYVSPMSQGLRRRFQFVTVPVPTDGGTLDQPISEELNAAHAGAAAWLSTTYGHVLPEDSLTDARDRGSAELPRLQRVMDGLRRPSSDGANGVSGWPAGTAQVVDILRVLLLSATRATDGEDPFDMAVADRLVPQMNAISREQFVAFEALLDREGMPHALRELRHLYDPHSVT